MLTIDLIRAIPSLARTLTFICSRRHIEIINQQRQLNKIFDFVFDGNFLEKEVFSFFVRLNCILF